MPKIKQGEANANMQEAIRELRKKYNITGNLGASKGSHSNIVDIMTYDDLLKRFRNILNQIK